MHTIYMTPHGKYSLYNFEGYSPVKAHFIETASEGDWNIKSYSRKKLKSSRSESRELEFFIGNPGHEKDIEAELKRGFQFFDMKQGILFGARVELNKMGKFVRIPA